MGGGFFLDAHIRDGGSDATTQVEMSARGAGLGSAGAASGPPDRNATYSRGMDPLRGQ